VDLRRSRCVPFWPPAAWANPRSTQGGAILSSRPDSKPWSPELLARLLKEALIRGEFERGDTSRITGLPERTAGRVLDEVITAGLLASATPKGAVSLRFPAEAQEIIFPRLFPET
jgi:hypothetical protein